MLNYYYLLFIQFWYKLYKDLSKRQFSLTKEIVEVNFQMLYNFHDLFILFYLILFYIILLSKPNVTQLNPKQL